jgi:AraC-like DNA-binding protein
MTQWTSPAVQERFGEFFLDLLGQVVNNSPSLTRERSTVAALFRAKRFINRHASNPSLDPDLVAENACVSVDYLNRLFKADGTSTMRCVWDIRLERAFDLLTWNKGDRLQIKDLAHRCGFSTASHFSRSFKETYGISPREMMRLNTGENR